MSCLSCDLPFRTNRRCLRLCTMFSRGLVRSSPRKFCKGLIRNQSSHPYMLSNGLVRPSPLVFSNGLARAPFQSVCPCVNPSQRTVREGSHGADDRSCSDCFLCAPHRRISAPPKGPNGGPLSNTKGQCGARSLSTTAPWRAASRGKRASPPDRRGTH